MTQDLHELTNDVYTLLESSGGVLPAIELVEQLETRGYSPADVSAALAHLLTHGRVTMDSERRVRAGSGEPLPSAQQ